MLTKLMEFWLIKWSQIKMVTKVTEPTKIITDKLVLKVLANSGIDKDYVEFLYDYAPRNKGRYRSPYTKTYRDLLYGNNIMVSSGLPMVTPEGWKNRPEWLTSGNKFISDTNLFNIEVTNTDCIIECLYNQPTKVNRGDTLKLNPQLYVGGVIVPPINKSPKILDIDPRNEYYQGNVLEWDYGICKRRLRIIEGRIHGSWVFLENPHSETRIIYNQSGNFRLKLGQYKVDDDTEVITTEQFAAAQYPFTVNDSSTFYPDADPETSSVDGWTQGYSPTNTTWTALVNHAGHAAADDTPDAAQNAWYSGTSLNTWRTLRRADYLYDTSSLGDTVIITGATLSVYCYNKYMPSGATPVYNIYTSNPLSNTELVAADYPRVGGTALATGIAHADIDAAGYNDWVLNTTGLATIPLDGVAKYSMRTNYDVEDSQPAWTSAEWNGISCYFSEQGSGFKPKLVVTYTTPSVQATLSGVDGVSRLAKVNGIPWSRVAGINGLSK